MPVLAVDGSCYDVSDSEQRYGCTNGNISCEDSGLFTASVGSSSKVTELGSSAGKWKTHSSGKIVVVKQVVIVVKV